MLTPKGQFFSRWFQFYAWGAAWWAHHQACDSQAGIDAAGVEDVSLGCGMPGGETGMNIGRNTALVGGCLVTTSGTTINRFCSSGLQAVPVAPFPAPLPTPTAVRMMGSDLTTAWIARTGYCSQCVRVLCYSSMCCPICPQRLTPACTSLLM